MKPTFKFTDTEISDKLYSIICRLEANEIVELEEIEETDEFILGHSMCINGVDTSLLKGREGIQRKVYNTLNTRGSIITNPDGNISFTGPIDKNRRLDVVVGLPASGKSSSVANVISEELHSLLLDNDEVKKLIPGYHDGWGDGIVHQESKKINKKLILQAIKEGKNIVYPKVGGYGGEILNIMKKAKQNGYTVNLHYVELDRNKALLRLLNRFISDGRFIPPSTIYQDDNEIEGNKIKKVFNELISSGYVDGYSIWNNDVEKGQKPILVESHNLVDNFVLNARNKITSIVVNAKDNLTFIEAKFDERYGPGKAAFFRNLEDLASKNSKIDMSCYNPDFSLEKLILILNIQANGLYIKSLEHLNEKELSDILLKFEPIESKIERFSVKSSNTLSKDIQIEYNIK